MSTRVKRMHRRGRPGHGGIETDEGDVHAPIVISNAGIQPTVLKLVGAEHFDKSYANTCASWFPPTRSSATATS